MKLLYFLAIIGILNSCQKGVADNKNYRSFNTEESKELDKIIQFFESKICESSEESKKCYDTFFTSEMPRRFVSQDYLWKKQELDTLLNSLSEELRNEIWEVRSDGTYLNKKGKYFEMLKKDATLKRYLMAMDNNNQADFDGIYPKMSAFVLTEYSNFDMAKKEHRLFISIHYLSLSLGM